MAVRNAIFRLVLVLFAAGACLAPGGGSASGGFDAALVLLAGKSAKKRMAGIEALAASAHPAAAPILSAMVDGRLYYRKDDKRLFVVAKRGREFDLFDPVAGEQAGTAPSKSLKKVKVNNRLRRAIRKALAGLNLTHADRAIRLEAAAGLLKSADPGLRPALVAALEREADGDVRAAMELALAAVDIGPDSTPAVRIAAAERLGASESPEARALLGRVVGDAKTDAAVREAARAALQQIEDRLELYRQFGAVFQGISLGSVLLLAAVGLAITFGVMGVINMAHGEMVMVGAYATFVVQELFRTFAPEFFGLSLAVAVPAAFLAAAALGVGLERSVIRWLYGRPLETLLATWGVSLVLRQAVRTIFGPTNREVGSPEWMSGAMELAGGVAITYNRIWIILFSLAVLAAVMAVIRYTAFGLEMRAVTQNRPMANAMGIRSRKVDSMTFALGSGVAGMAGVALSQIDNVSPNLGQAYIVDSFMVIVFGGVGNLWGVLVGAMSLGVVNKFIEPFSGAVLGKIVILVALILFIQRRPQGLFAMRGRAAEL